MLSVLDGLNQACVCMSCSDDCVLKVVLFLFLLFSLFPFPLKMNEKKLFGVAIAAALHCFDQIQVYSTMTPHLVKEALQKMLPCPCKKRYTSLSMAPKRIWRLPGSLSSISENKLLPSRRSLGVCVGAVSMAASLTYLAMKRRRIGEN